MFLNINAEFIRCKQKVTFSQLDSFEKALVLKSIAEVMSMASTLKCPSHKVSIITITIAIAGDSAKIILDTCCTTMASIMEMAVKDNNEDFHIFSRNMCELWKLN